MKRWISLLIVILTMCATLLPVSAMIKDTPPDACRIFGKYDVNDDGAVNKADVQTITEYIMCRADWSWRMDVNDDGKVNVLDAGLVTRAYVPRPATYTVSAYCPCKICCGKTNGITASGVKAVQGITAASSLPFGTVLMIEGLGKRIVQDRGASGRHIDIFFNDHKTALNFGVQHRKVEVIR